MKVDINPRGNGACPLCVNASNCRIKDNLSNSVVDISNDDGAAIEVVIYSCPLFKENA
jgi:hypothetical protein